MLFTSFPDLVVYTRLDKFVSGWRAGTAFRLHFAVRFLLFIVALVDEMVSSFVLPIKRYERLEVQILSGSARRAVG